MVARLFTPFSLAFVCYSRRLVLSGSFWWSRTLIHHHQHFFAYIDYSLVNQMANHIREGEFMLDAWFYTRGFHWHTFKRTERNSDRMQEPKLKLPILTTQLRVVRWQERTTLSENNIIMRAIARGWRPQNHSSVYNMFIVFWYWTWTHKRTFIIQ